MKLVEFIEQVWMNGSVRGRVFFRATNVRPYGVTNQVAFAQVTISGDPYQILDKAGNVKRQYPATSGQVSEVSLVRSGDRWLVQDVKTER